MCTVLLPPGVNPIAVKYIHIIARLGEERGVFKVLVGKPEGKRPLGNPGLDGRVILGWIFRKWDVGVWT
jgi:hypothetical protein